MNDKSVLRSSIFKHLDGLVIAPVAFSLYKFKVLEYLIDKKETSLQLLTETFKANEGYLNVGLRVLASQGFIDYQVDNETDVVTVAVNKNSAYAFSLFPLYEDVVHLLETTDLFTSVEINVNSISKLESVFKKFETNFGMAFSNNEVENQIQNQILKHIEGYLVGPITVSLGMTGMFIIILWKPHFVPKSFTKSLKYSKLF